jgi:hypothetical protein
MLIVEILPFNRLLILGWYSPQESGKLFLRVAAADMVEQGAQDSCLDLEGRSRGRWKVQIIKTSGSVTT